MSDSKVRSLVYIAILAALYTVLSMAVAPLAFGPWQFRISEMLTLMALLGWRDIYGLTLGCFMANLIGVLMGANGIGIMDIAFGTMATFVAGVLTYRLKDVTFKGIPFLSALMPVIINGIIIGLELAIITSAEGASFMAMWWTMGLEVAVSEFIVVVIIGIPVYMLLKSRGVFHE